MACRMMPRKCATVSPLPPAMMIGGIIGFTVGGLAIAFKSAEKELARLDKEVKDAHKQNKSKG